jgi:flagella basal body P-ring formation protein FlgA
VGRKHPEGKNIRRDKTSGGTKHPEGQNIRRDKTSGDERPLWVTFSINNLGTFSLILMKKSIERGGEISQANDFATLMHGGSKVPSSVL